MEPILAAKITDINKLRFPLIGTPKIDGIRCLMYRGEAVSRKLKLIPNRHIQAYLQQHAIEGLDGELVVDNEFNATTSGVMSQDGTPSFTYWLLDYWLQKDQTYLARLLSLDLLKNNHMLDAIHIKVLPHARIQNMDELLAYEAYCLEQGYEGVCLRAPSSPYKYGRSTFKEHYLLKMKRFVDDEAVIIGFEEMMHNSNELQEDNLGRAKRSKAQDGMVPLGTLGKFCVRHPKFGEFKIGTGQGLTQDLRQHIWNNTGAYIGKTITFKYQPHGTLEKPRIPLFKGVRLD